MIVGYSAIAVGFFIAAVFIAWSFLEKRKILTKSIIMVAMIWYAVVVYFSIPFFMGWPSNALIPKESIVVAILIHEPMGEDEGGIFLWLKDMDKKATDKGSVRNLFRYINTKEPRAYKLSYSRDFHKKLIDGKKKAEKQGGIMRLSRNEAKRKDSQRRNRGHEDEIRLRIINPVDILKKGGNEESEF